jgi:proton glutamate symport protein
MALHPDGFACLFLLRSFLLLGRMFLAVGTWLAVPLIFASIVRGADGLEPMRGVARLAWKTGGWIAGSSAVAAAVGLGVALLLRPPVPNIRWATGATGVAPYSFEGEMWTAFVLIAVGLGLYRNQIEETRARLLLRLATAIDESLTLLLEWAVRIVPAAVFCLALTSSAASLGSADNFHRVPGLLGALLVGWLIYGAVVLPLILLGFARVNPWRYLLAVGSPLATALAGGSPPQVFALTLDRVRTEAGVSNRVGSVTLAACTALLRDGQTLGWSLAAAWMFFPAPNAVQCGEIFLATWLVGCAGAAVVGAAAPLLVLSSIPGALPDGGFLLGLGVLISLAGNAVSVFSHTCAAAVIARSEGETNFLRTPPHSALSDPLPLGTSIL